MLSDTWYDFCHHTVHYNNNIIIIIIAKSRTFVKVSEAILYYYDYYCCSRPFFNTHPNDSIYVLINHTHSRIPILMFNRTFSSFALLHTHTNSFFRRHRHTVTNRSIVIVAFVAAASRLRFNGPVVYIDGFIMCIYYSWSGHTIPLRWPLFSWFNKLLLSFFFDFV
jgi:hypothetical protein